MGAEDYTGIVVTPLQLLPEAFVDTYAVLLTRLGIFVLAFLVLYAVGVFVLKPWAVRAMEAGEVEPTIRAGLQRFGGLVVFLASIVIAALLAGFAELLAASAIVVAAITVSVGVAARELTGNLVSGFVIVADPDINYGDWIRTGEVEGTITDIGYRATRIRTWDNELVAIPNSALISSTVTNISIHDVLRTSQEFAIGYEDDVDLAMEILAEEAAAHEEILEIPEPTVLLRRFGSSAVVLEARYWIASPTRADLLEVRSSYGRTVKARFAEAGITLQPPSPHELSGHIEVAGDGADVA